MFGHHLWKTGSQISGIYGLDLVLSLRAALCRWTIRTNLYHCVEYVLCGIIEMPLDMVPRANLQQRLCRKLEQCLISFRLPTIQSNNPQVVLDDHWSLPPAPSYKVNVVGQFLPKLRGLMFAWWLRTMKGELQQLWVRRLIDHKDL